MSRDIRISAALMAYSVYEQRQILNHVEAGTTPTSKRLQEGVEKVLPILEEVEEVVLEGYAGFPVEKEAIMSKKGDDRNIGRVIQMGGSQMLITGRRTDGRYSVMNKDGGKTAKDPADLGVVTKESVVGIDAEDIIEGLKQARKNVGASKCWDGYKAKGTKTKNGKQVPNCVKEEEEDIEEGYKGKHGQSDKEYADSRSPGGKMVSGDSKRSGAEYTHGRRVKAANPGMQPDVGGKTKPKSQGKMDKGTRADLQFRKANLKKEEYEQVEEEKKGLYANIHAKRARGERPAKPGEKDYPAKDAFKKAAKTAKESIDFSAFIDFDDDEIDLLSFQEIEAICEEVFVELEQEGLLSEALQSVEGIALLTEDYYDSAVKASKAASKTPEAKAGRRNLRKEKIKAAVKSAATKVGSAAGTVAGKAVNAGEKAVGAAKSVPKAVGSAAKKAGSSVAGAGSAIKSGAKKVARGAGEVAGSAAGGFASGYAAARNKGGSSGGGSSTSGGSSSSSSSGSGYGSSSSSSSSSNNSGSSAGSSKPRTRLRDRIKSGLKKAIGGAARSVSRGARNVARRMGESYSWRDAIGYEGVKDGESNDPK
tara:strand:- start:15570 stop:17345 length:1776 start_codon:yes stop_codon:yes gene_type:complete